MTVRSVPPSTVARLPLYLRALDELAESGVTTTSSGELAASSGVTPALLRRDLSSLGSHGVRGVGYDVEHLQEQVATALGVTGRLAVVIVGVGNRKAGEGRMEITESTPSLVAVDLEFLKPFRATNVTTFTLVPSGDHGTEVTWTMTGQRNPVMSVMGTLFFDKAIGRDFERGLANLKRTAEQA